MKRLTLIPLPFLFLALSLSACSDKNREYTFEPEAPPPTWTGNIIVQMAMTGSSDQGAVGCGITLDGQYCGSLHSEGSITLRNVQPGPHTVALVQVPKDCHVTDGTSKTVHVLRGQTYKVRFSMQCRA